MKSFSYGVLLFVFWLLLSGYFEPLLLGLGLASVVLTVFLTKRMNIIDRESYPLHLSSQFPVFLVYILREIIIANIDVIKRIMSSNSNSINPQVIEITVPQKTDLGRVIFANSITLTPGTVSMELTQDKVTIHALTENSANALHSGEMAKAIPDQATN